MKRPCTHPCLDPLHIQPSLPFETSGLKDNTAYVRRSNMAMRMSGCPQVSVEMRDGPQWPDSTHQGASGGTKDNTGND